jgi:hypothetical protein
MSQEGIIDAVGSHPEIPTEFLSNVIGQTAVPIANQIELLGDVVANAGIPFRSVASGNTLTHQVQISDTSALSDSTKNGIAHFDSTDFAIDGDGFVTLAGAGAGQTITGNDAVALPPTLGNWNIYGAVTAAGSNPVITSGAASTLTVNVQKSQALASSDATKIGLSNFDKVNFTLDSNGFVASTYTHAFLFGGM